MVESAGFENRYLGQPGSRVRIPPSPPGSRWIHDDRCLVTNSVVGSCSNLCVLIEMMASLTYGLDQLGDYDHKSVFDLQAR